MEKSRGSLGLIFGVVCSGASGVSFFDQFKRISGIPCVLILKYQRISRFSWVLFSEEFERISAAPGVSFYDRFKRILGVFIFYF